MPLPELPFRPQILAGREKPQLRMTPELQEWIKRAHTTPSALTNFLLAVGVSPSDVVAREHMIVLNQVTGRTSKLLAGLGIKRNDLKISIDGRLFLKQDFIPTRGDERRFKISTIAIPRLARELETGLFPFFIETIVFFGPPGAEKAILRDIHVTEKAGKRVVLRGGMERYEIENQTEAMKRHIEVVTAIKSSVEKNKRRTRRRLPPRNKKLPNITKRP